MSNVSESSSKKSLWLWLLSMITWCFERLFPETAEKGPPHGHCELKYAIASLPDESSEKQEALSNLRAEYREVSAYSIHYSNARTALAVFFLGSSHIFLFTQLQKVELSTVILFGPFLMLMGYGIHFQLTRIMQSALKKLVQIEEILSPMSSENDENNTYMKPYFLSWAGELGKENSRAGDAVREMFSKFYLIFAVFYLIVFFVGISIHYYSTPESIVSIQPNATYQFNGKMKIILEEESTN